jgi:hypothetical protein
MSQVGTIRERLAAALDIDGYTAKARTTVPETRMITVIPGVVDYGTTMGGRGREQKFSVRVFVDEPSQDTDAELDRLMSGVIDEAIAAAGTLDGVADDVAVTRCSGHQLFGRAEALPLLGAEWTVQVSYDAERNA